MGFVGFVITKIDMQLNEDYNQNIETIITTRRDPNNNVVDIRNRKAVIACVSRGILKQNSRKSVRWSALSVAPK